MQPSVTHTQWQQEYQQRQSNTEEICSSNQDFKPACTDLGLPNQVDYLIFRTLTNHVEHLILLTRRTDISESPNQ